MLKKHLDWIDDLSVIVWAAAAMVIASGVLLLLYRAAYSFVRMIF